MDTLLPLLFMALLATFGTMLSLCLYDMFRMARRAERRHTEEAARRRSLDAARARRIGRP